MCAQIQYASFLVRLWRSQDSNGALLEWHSQVEHIQSGQTWTFLTLEQLEDFIHQSTLQPEGLAWTAAQAAEQ